VRVGICSLRTYDLSDAESLSEAAHESVAEVSLWLPWCREQYRNTDAAEWISSRALLRAEGREYHFAIVGIGGELLGGCGISQINRIHKFGNVGYWVRTSATGRGVATEAVRRLAEFAFQNTDLVRLEIVCAAGNERSGRVAVRAGAIREGVLRKRLLLRGRPVDATMYGLVRNT
jgi:ribosomal-protein-serine acetyltransferase